MCGRFQDRDVTVQDVFEAVGAVAAGQNDACGTQRLGGEGLSGAGACGGQFTANTMATALTLMGVSPWGLNDLPAEDPGKPAAAAAVAAGKQVMALIRQAAMFERLCDGSLFGECRGISGCHWWFDQCCVALVGIGPRVPENFYLGRFGPVSARTPVLADLKPGGRFTAPDLTRAGGTGLLASHLWNAGLLHDEQTVLGRRISDLVADEENAGPRSGVSGGGSIGRSRRLGILKGSLAPKGAWSSFVAMECVIRGRPECLTVKKTLLLPSREVNSTR